MGWIIYYYTEDELMLCLFVMFDLCYYFQLYDPFIFKIHVAVIVLAN